MSQIPKEVFLRAKVGSEEAWRMIVESYTKSAYNIAYRMTYDPASAEDLTQDIFLTLYKNINSYDAEYPFEPWFYRMASNVCINFMRREKREFKIDKYHTEPATTESDSPESEMDSIFHNALNGLQPEYKMVITLKYLEHQSIEGIADYMRVPVGTVKTWLFRARSILKDKLSKYVEI